MVRIQFVRYIFLFILFYLYLPLNARVYHDTINGSLDSLFIYNNAKYVIRYNHTFEDTIIIPNNSEIKFEGGSLSGPICFNDSYLTGNVNLKGSNISGKLKNKVFEATWICAADGVSDDAPVINKLITICDCIHFSRGKYRLKSIFNPSPEIPQELYSELYAHIGINRNGVRLLGEDGAEFISDEPCGTIFIYTAPNKIEKSCSDIVISGLKFSVNNDGNIFHEFMHTIKLMGSNGVIIKNNVFNDFWGDAIGLSHYGDNPQTGERTRNQNVKIINNTIIGGHHHNNRNGISIINGKNVLIKGNTIKNTSRKDMPGGIDVEPNNSAYTIDNIRIEDNVLEGIQGSGGAICVVVFRDGPAHNISIIGNKISNSSNGLFVYVLTDKTSDKFVIKNNVIASNTRPYYFKGDGRSSDWIIKGNKFKHPCGQSIPGNIIVDGLVVKKNKKKVL